MKAMVLKTGAYGPEEHTDVDAVFDTIVDPNCTTWRRTLHGAKTGNLKDLVQIGRTMAESGKMYQRMQDPTQRPNGGGSWPNGREIRRGKGVYTLSD